MRSQLDWVQAEMDGNSGSVSLRSSLSLKVIGLDTDSPAVDGLVVGTSTDGPVESPMECEGFSAGFSSDGLAVAQLECFSVSPRNSVSLTVSGSDSDSPTVDGLEVGTYSSFPTAAPMEFKGSLCAGFRTDGPAVAQMVLFGNPSSRLSFEDFTGIPGNTVLDKEEMALSEAILGEEENLTVCNPLVTIIPPGLALTME